MKNIRVLKLIGLLSLLLVSTVDARSPSSAPYLQDELNTIDIFNRVSPIVVYVYRVRRIVGNYDTYYVRAGTGSGFFWDRRGHIVTNYHILHGARGVAVSFNNGKKAYKARVVGVEPRKDIAVLKISEKSAGRYLKSIKLLKLADSDKLKTGQKALAIGNPFGLDRTLTTGIVSALGRRVRGIGGVSIYDMVQTDASINPGNSGGPLLNSRGELIGMNTSIYSRSGSSSGIGFAVPSNTISRITTQLIKHGRVVQKGFGIYKLDVRLAARLEVSGLVIGQIAKKSPAAEAGLRGTHRDRFGDLVLGDIIVAINGKPVRNYDDYYNILEKLPLGQAVSVKYIRNRKASIVNIVVKDITKF